MCARMPLSCADERPEAALWHAESRERGNVAHVVVVTGHYSNPRSSPAYRTTRRLLPMVSSSKSTVTFMSRPTPESSAIVPDPKRACFTRSPFTKRGASCDASASLSAHERSTACPGRRDDADCENVGTARRAAAQLEGGALRHELRRNGLQKARGNARHRLAVSAAAARVREVELRSARVMPT